jgi:hypothetical protein
MYFLLFYLFVPSGVLPAAAVGGLLAGDASPSSHGAVLSVRGVAACGLPVSRARGPRQPRGLARRVGYRPHGTEKEDGNMTSQAV